MAFVHLQFNGGRCPIGDLEQLTLQKSILLTPLEPRAGPTGGEGLACPAPTISLTIWSFASAFFAIMGLLRGYLGRLVVGAWNFCGGRCGADRRNKVPIYRAEVNG